MIFESLQEKYNYYRSLTDYKLMPNTYIMMMLDGRSFSKFIKKRFKLPFDDAFIGMMNETAKYLCEQIAGVKLAYVQSDEITLVIDDNSRTEPFFGNRLSKLLSIGASIATAKFNRMLTTYWLENFTTDEGKDDEYGKNMDNKFAEIPLVEFDCKAWNLPNLNEVIASILYRQIDCIRNSKQQTAQTYLTHKELLKKDTDEQVSLLKEKTGIDWKTFSEDKKYGRYLRKVAKQLTKTFVKKNGIEETVTFERQCWEATPMPQLTDEESRKVLMEIFEEAAAANTEVQTNLNTQVS